MSRLRPLFLPLLPVLLLAVAAGVFVVGFAIPEGNALMMRLKKDHSRQSVDLLNYQLQTLVDLVDSGVMDTKQAQTFALAHLVSARFGPNGSDYFWILDTLCNVIAHPVRPEIVGVDPSNVMGADGNPLAQTLHRFCKTASAQPNGGFVEYTWYQNNNTTIGTKHAFVRLFPAWGWVLGTGIHTQDLVAESHRQKSRILVAGGIFTLLTLGLAGFLAARSYSLEMQKRRSLQQIIAEEMRFKSLFQKSPAGITILDPERRTIVQANPSAHNHMGSDTQIIRILTHALLDDTPLDLHPIEVEQGKQLLLSTSLVQVPGIPRPCIMAMTMDITELSKWSTELHQTKRQLSLINQIYENAHDAVAIVSADNTFLAVNPAFEAITGYTFEDLRGKKPNILKSGKHDDAFYATMWNTLAQEHSWEGEIINRRKSGETYTAYLSIKALVNDKGAITEYVAISKDITELAHKRDELKFQESTDQLTGLVNSSHFRMRIDEALVSGHKGVLLVMGLDRFRRVNQGLGMNAGDQVLQKTAERLRQLFPENDSLARIGGDEFGILLSIQSEHLLKELADSLSRTMQEPMMLEEQEVVVALSAGVARYPEDGRTCEALLSNAYKSLVQTKKEQPGTLGRYLSDTEKTVIWDNDLENDLRRSLVNKDFVMHFQPKVYGGSLEFHGAESLMRWNHPRQLRIAPPIFIAAAEEMGAIEILGQHALRQSCQQAKIWQHEFPKNRIAVNVSPRQFHLPDFVSQVLRILDEEECLASIIELEVTETAVFHDMERTKKVMKTLIDKGITFTLDDFGTGYSSLSHLRSLPISGFKIDKSFTDEICGNRETRSIVNTLLGMGTDLGLEVTVEGVETQEQADLLVQSGHQHIVQGYLVAKPMPKEALEQWITQRRKTTLST